MLGYRTFVNVTGSGEGLLDLVGEQIYAWVRAKGWDADALVDDETVRLAEGVEGTLTRLTTQDGAQTLRLETVEAAGWTLRLTAHLPGVAARPPWVWADVESPDGRRVDPPKLVRWLVDVLDARDGQHELPSGLIVATENEVDAVLERVLDPQRRTIAFVAGSADGIPLARWSEHIAKLTQRSAGISSTTVLDPAATARFAAEIDAGLAVKPWTLRTFMPRVNESDPNDPLRHRYLGTQRIIDEPAPRIAKMLGSRAAAVIRELPLPREAVRVDRALSKHLDEVVIGRITDVPASTTAMIDEAARTAVREPTLEDRVRPAEAAPTVAVSVDVAAVLSAGAGELVGAETLDLATMENLVALAARGRRAGDQQVAVRARVDQLQAEIERLTGQLEDATGLLVEEQLEHHQTELDRARADDLVVRLRRRLDAEPEGSWGVQAATDEELAPLDFAGLLLRLHELTVVVFTGDEEVLLGLDTHDSGRWAVKAWEALCALEDYGIAKRDGRHSGHVDGYLQSTPSGCRGFSANRHARDESEDVRNNARYRKAREFPIREGQGQDARVFMGAHFKLAQSGLLSPRLHYHDDTAQTGKVYVGYLGPHLPTKQTN